MKSVSALIIFLVIASFAYSQKIWTGSYYVATINDFCCIPLSKATINDIDGKVTFTANLNKDLSACNGLSSISQTIDKTGTSAKMIIDNYGDITITEKEYMGTNYLEYRLEATGRLFGLPADIDCRVSMTKSNDMKIASASIWWKIWINIVILLLIIACCFGCCNVYRKRKSAEIVRLNQETQSNSYLAL